MKTTRYLMATTIVMAAVALTPAQAEVRRPSFSHTMDSTPAPSQAQADRTIEITPQTQWVNVKRLEVVRFVNHVNGDTRAFTWQAPAHALKPVSLSDIAPAGFVEQPVTVYVAPSRLSR